MGNIVARSKECQQLDAIYQQKQAAFVAVYGRRRIGKTYLIKHFFEDKGIYFHLTGVFKASLITQLNNFANEFADVFCSGEIQEPPKSWFIAFNQLRQKISECLAQQKQKVILFFDELPWLASPRSGFLQALEHCWNRYFADLPNLVLVVCGSAASWMIKHIIHNKGGLHGRITHQVHLKPFTLAETEEFLQARNVNFNRKQIIDLYIALGGVAYYLNFIERGLSCAQNINKLCFISNGALYQEFDKLYRSLFKHHQTHVKIVRILAKQRQGLTYNELVNAAKLSSGGRLSNILNELVAAGFVLHYREFGKPKRKMKYRLIDEYSLFYLTWCSKQRDSGIVDEDQTYWLKQQNTSAWQAWSGYAFEGVCLKHLDKIKNALGISGVQTYSSKWSYIPVTKSEQGTEIDLIIDRADQCINLCEIKYYKDIFSIDKQYANTLHKKKQVFIEKTNITKAIFMILITTFGTRHNDYFVELIDKELILDDLF